MLHILYRGPEVTQEEQACRHLLKSRLLQRCVWKVECGTVISPVTPPPHLEGSELTLTRGSGTDTEKEPSSSDEGTPMDEDVSVMGAVLPRIKLSPAIMHKLRKLSGRAALQFRPSIREVLEPDVLEETVVSVVIKHLGLFEILQQLSVSEEGTQTADFQLLCDIMGEAFKKLNALERQLQALAEMEQKWQNDVEEAGQGQLHDNTPFFLNFHLQETTRKDLALLCYLKEVELNPVDLEGTIKTLKELFDKDVSMAMKERPFLLKTRLLLEKLLARAELLLHVTIETEESGPGLARSMSQHPSSMPPGGDVPLVSPHLARSISALNMSSPPPPPHTHTGMPPGGDVPLVSPHLARSISAPSTFDAESGGLSQGRADLGSTGRWKRQRGQAVMFELVEDRGKPDKPAHAVLLDQLFSFIGSSLEENVSCSSFLSAASVRWQRGNSRKQALVHMVELLTAAARVGGATHLVSAVTSVLQHGPKVEELTCGGMVNQVDEELTCGGMVNQVVEELTCGGMVNQVREAFAETMTSVVQLASTYPIACSNSIGLLCVIPYTRAEERCLVRSGLVQLLDKLCSLSSYRDQSNTETQTIKQRVSAMAWAGFQVLSNRCVMWEDEEGAASAVEHSGLARQVSALLTNHLARATECSGDEAAGTEALQEVLSLLNNLSRSKLGKAILSQPACVSKLLSLLLDQRPSPKLVLIVLQLCRVALPLISAEDCEKIQLPSWGQDMHVFDGGIQDPAARIASLLLAKLGDYVVPGAQTALSLASPDHSQPSAPSSAAVHGGTGDRERLEETEAQDGRIAVYVHKREDQSSHEVIQPLLSKWQDGRIAVYVHKREDQSSHEVIQPLLSCDGRPFRLGSGANMEKVVRMDRDLTRSGRAEVITEDAVTAIRRAAKWAQAGLVVSTGPPADGTGQEGGSTDRKRMASSAVCREKNAELARADPVRPFISGQVANSMAGEVIGLLHGLLTAPESSTAQIWASAVERVLINALIFAPQVLTHALTFNPQVLTHALLCLPTLLTQSDVVLSPSSSGPAIADFLTTARQVVAALCALGGFREGVKPGTMVQVVAALCALGGFREGVKPGTMVQITGEGMQAVPAQVVSISEQQGVATVRFESADKMAISSDTLQVPLTRVQPPKAEALPLDQLSMTEKVIEAQKALLVPQPGQCVPAIQAPLPAGTDGSSALMAAVRVMAEIRTRSCMVLATHLGDRSFAARFVENSASVLNILRIMADEFTAGQSAAPPVMPVGAAEKDCLLLRPSVRDWDRIRPKEITWCTSRVFPPPRSCLFSHGLSGVAFLGDPSAGSGLPRGTFLYASAPVPSQRWQWAAQGNVPVRIGTCPLTGNTPVPSQAPSFYWEIEAPSFYWEIEVCSFGETDDESGPIISFGFAPTAEKRDGAWTNPVGTVLFHNNGRAVHYNGSSLLQWKSARLDVTLSAGDVAGIGWERVGEAPSVQGEQVKGRVYFTYNGQRLPAVLDDVSGGMWPVIHIQKKVRQNSTTCQMALVLQVFMWPVIHIQKKNTRIRANFGSRPFAFAEGQHHRNAADMSADTTEEISATFGLLPFHLGEDSDSETAAAGASGEEETPPQGPPVRIAMAPEAQPQYNSSLAVQYRLQLSYDNFLTSGPDMRAPLLVQQEDESDDENAEEDLQQEDHFVLFVCEEDHYALLVKAWEQKVFPTIRRRFRNEAERKSGLEQIKGALQLGMVDIARQTVEFLYEENGGMPRDLHLPTIEDIRAEAMKFTIERVRKGMTVVIRHPQTAGVLTTGSTVLPKFAVRGMLKTFGSTGVVLDVDSHNELVQVEIYLRSGPGTLLHNELVQVETYLRSEGVLVRYWYPIDMLERPPQGTRKASITGVANMDTSNIQIHRQLLQCESSLVHYYCRTALLSLLSHSNNLVLSPPRQLLQCESSLVHYYCRTALLSLLSHCNNLVLSPPRQLLQCESSLVHYYCRTALLSLLSHCRPHILDRCPVPSMVETFSSLSRDIDPDYMQLLSNQLLSCPAPNGSVVTLSLEDAVSPQRCLVTHGCAASTVFHSRDHPLREELRNAIVMAACHGEDTLIDLSDQLCACLQTAPELFAYEEFPVTETKVNTDAYFPGAAFLVVSCRTDPDVPRKDTALYKSPWARLFCYGIGHQLRKNGHVALQEVTCYPRDAAIAGTGGLTPPPLADQYPPAVLPCDRVHVRVGVSPPPGYVVTIHAVPPEFALAISFIEELISVKHQVDSKDGRMEEQAASSYDIPAGAFVHLVELLGGYVWKSDVPAALKEVMFHLLAELLRASQPRKEDGDVCLLTLSPSLALLTHVSLQAELRKLYDHENKRRTRSDVIGSGEYSRFSSYFHALMEVALAVAEVTSPVGTTVPVTTATAVTSATPAPSGAPYPYPSASPPSPMLGAKRKKIRARRERDRGAMGGKHKPQLHPESEGGVSMVSKPEEMLWFHRAVTMSLILRYLAFRDPQGEVVTNDAVADACQTLTVPTAHSRLLVLSGIPMHLEQGAVRDAIRKACNMYGGLFRDEVFVPLQEKEDLPVPPGEVLSPSAAPVEQTAEGQAAEPADGGEVEAGLEEAASVGGQVAMGDEASTAADLETQQLLASTLDSAPLPAPLASPEQDSPSADLPPDGAPPPRSHPPASRATPWWRSGPRAKWTTKAIVGVVTYDTEELIDVTTDDMLSVSPVNLNLLSDPQGSPALGDYLRHKILSKSSASGLTQKAQDVLTEIFHSCVVSEHAFSLESPELEQHELVHLGKDQISLQTPMNHLHAFFSNIKGPKKSFMEQVSQVLRRYGVPKPKLKESEKPWKGPKLGNGKPSGKKLAQKPSKEKLALAEVTGAKAVVQKPSPGEKKGKSKPQEKPGKPGKDQTEDGAKRETPEDKYLTLEGFLLFVADKTKQDARSVWKAILACGYDLHFDRCACVDTAHAVQTSKQWTLQMDCALVEYVDSLCRHLAISAARLHPHELYLREAELASPAFACLQGVPVESLRLRFALLLSLNNTLETFFLPLVDLRPCRTYPNSTAALLSRARRLMFYDTKVVVMNSILNATAQRNPSQAAPEITLDPLEIVGGEAVTAMGTQFCQAARQLSIVPSSQLCVKLASGGDPTYAFNVRFTGEEVHGTSGSFRHFLWQVCKELQGPILNLLMLCPSATANRNKGKYILRPGPLTYGEEKLLEFLGQLLGVAVRADVPLPLDLLTPFWKGLVGLPLDEDDLREADILTFNYITRLAEAETESDFWAVCAEVCPAQLQEGEGGEHPLCSFTFSSVTGEDVELCPGGRNRMLSWENRVEYLSCIRALRLDELRCSNRMAPVLAGLATIVPVQILHILSPADLELRTCGMPHVDLAFLRSHTMYQVGLMETDTHIEFFWSSLESFSQDQLRKFVKFACNQERIPCTCPCKDGGPDTAHVPPYPMKIAPPDGPGSPDLRYIRVETCMFMITFNLCPLPQVRRTRGSPDSRYIRVETCMFMIKLPQYSSQETMTERLLYAINCREDPLSG
ncbi:putative E3 ubiquitin-protein ligase HTD4 [Branchiostoma belcheri]|nr:putative E3 ubiquitin-protein ligase HTD4 [Branchiostoma belcheri]